jgi:non-specific serine/threonine protein kinase/serine/threonine-protein kinase
MGIKCPKCQTDNSDTQKFCGECGTQLKPSHAETRTLRTSAKESTIGEIVSEKYKLLEELGSGGMGVVYKAEQIEPIKRTVALKIVKLGMDTKQVVARFETERQSLAVMDHPNIAKVFDGGATETGRPYFVMELVHGVPVTEYCDKHKLSTRERLELFIQVCQAVQHAHQKGVIHRDLKPSNILVVIQEDKPTPKIIDFGIAKATEHRLSERTLFTEQGQLIGTPEYMSPEQAEMSGLDVDTRTDIYSLGVMLYELLVGALPFDPKTFREAGFGEIQRIIRETEPPKASTRLSDLGDTQTSIAEQRNTDITSLHRELKGDLDWITMKAMAKDRTRRYSSASELAVDIERHLKNEPILASPPSTIYHIKKYIGRHKVGVVAAALVILAMIIGITGMSIGLVKATKAEKKARDEAETAQQVSDFLVELFEVSDPSEARGNSITAREILDKGAERIDQELTELGV